MDILTYTLLNKKISDALSNAEQYVSVDSLPTANKTEWNKKLIYNYDNKLHYIEEIVSSSDNNNFEPFVQIPGLCCLGNEMVIVDNDLYLLNSKDIESMIDYELLKINLLTREIEILPYPIMRRQNASLICHNHKIYIVGGFNSMGSIIEIIDLKTNKYSTWKLDIPRLKSNDDYFSGELLGDDLILVALNPIAERSDSLVYRINLLTKEVILESFVTEQLKPDYRIASFYIDSVQNICYFETIGNPDEKPSDLYKINFKSKQIELLQEDINYPTQPIHLSKAVVEGFMYYNIMQVQMQGESPQLQLLLLKRDLSTGISSVILSEMPCLVSILNKNNILYIIEGQKIDGSWADTIYTLNVGPTYEYKYKEISTATDINSLVTELTESKKEIEKLKLDNAKLNSFIHSNLEGEASQEYTESTMKVPEFIDVEGYGYNRVQDNKKWTTDRVLGNTMLNENFIPFPYNDSSVVKNGITWTVNSDGSITANGTATADSNFYLGLGIQLTRGTYTISGSFGGSKSTYYILMADYSTDGPKTVSVSDGPANAIITIKSGVTVNNQVFKPMFNKGDVAKPFMKYFEGMQSSQFYQLVSTNKAGEPLKTWGKQKVVLRGVNDIRDEVYRREDNHAIKVDKTKEVNLIDLTWKYRSDIKCFNADNLPNPSLPKSSEIPAYIINDIYDTQKASNLFNNKKEGIGLSSFGSLLIYDPSLNGDLVAFKAKIATSKLVYATADTFETDLGQFTDADFELPIQVGGTIEQKSDTVVKATVEYGVPIILVNKDKEV